MSNDKTARADIYTREILQQYIRFLRTSGLNPLFYHMDADTLRVVVKRYLDDVDRIHRYHDIDLIDCHKIAGYLTYWICRLKPIRVVDKRGTYQGDIKDNVVRKIANASFYINEIFAIFLGLSRIDARLKKAGINKIVAIDKNFVNTLVYSLKYRPITGDMLSLVFYMTEKGTVALP
jgi:hypothetical protein